MAREVLERQIRKEPASSMEEFEERIRAKIESIYAEKDDDSARKQLISSINGRFHIKLKLADFNNISSSFLRDHLQCTLTSNTVVTSLVPQQYLNGTQLNKSTTSKMANIQNEWKFMSNMMDISDLPEFLETHSKVEVLLKSLDALFPGHVLRFQIMYKMCQIHKELDADSCPLFEDCLGVSKELFGEEHPQTLLVAVELAEMKKTADPALLDMVQRVFGRSSAAASIVVDVLSRERIESGDYDEAIDFLKRQIVMLDDRKSFGKDDYINLHLRIALIAERKKDYAMSIRFLSKLYHHLKKGVPAAKRQTLSSNMDIKMLCLLMSRLKLMMATEQKSQDILKKLKGHRQDIKSGNNAEDCNKKKLIILQNLCANPIQKTNDLMRNNAENAAVACWIDILKEFETNFLSADERVMSTDEFAVREL